MSTSPPLSFSICLFLTLILHSNRGDDVCAKGLPTVNLVNHVITSKMTQLMMVSIAILQFSSFPKHVCSVFFLHRSKSYGMRLGEHDNVDDGNVVHISGGNINFFLVIERYRHFLLIESRVNINGFEVARLLQSSLSFFLSIQYSS